MSRKPRVPVLRSSEPSPPKPTQRRSIEKRARILAAGRRLFAGKGYEAVSIADIAAQAGTSVGAFYQYFASKRQFLIVLMNELIQRLAALDLRPGGGSDLREGLFKFLAAVFREDAEHYGVVRAWQEAALSDAEFSRIERRIQSWTQSRVLAVLQILARYPTARPDVDLSRFAHMMDGHFWSLLARGPRLSRLEMNREVRLAADVIHHYLFG